MTGNAGPKTKVSTILYIFLVTEFSLKDFEERRKEVGRYEIYSDWQQLCTKNSGLCYRHIDITRNGIFMSISQIMHPEAAALVTECSRRETRSTAASGGHLHLQGSLEMEKVFTGEAGCPSLV